MSNHILREDLMKKVVLFSLCLALALSSVAILAAPVGNATWGTVNRTEIMTTLINAQADALAGTGGPMIPGMAKSLQMMIANAGRLNPDLAAIDTTALSADDMATYVDAVTNFNLVLRHALQVAADKQCPEVADGAKATLNTLIGVVMAQANADQVLYNALFNTRAPVSGSIWGTVN